MKTVASFTLIPLVLFALILIFANDGGVTDFISKIAVSTVTSFGGGEAYLSVADGIFVKGEYISSDLFYTRLVPVANALPGPILIKIATGIGYTIGAQHSYISGWLIAVLVTTVAVGLCSSIALIVMSLYDNVKDSKFIIGIKTNILPVICGMLISTSCSMLIESTKILGEKEIGFNVSVITISLWIAIMFAVTAKKHIKDIYLLLASAAMSLAVLMLIH